MITYHIRISSGSFTISVVYNEPLDLEELFNILLNFIDQECIDRVYVPSVTKQEVVIDISSLDTILENERLVKKLINYQEYDGYKKYDKRKTIGDLYKLIQYKQRGFPMKLSCSSNQVTIAIANVIHYEYKNDSMFLTVRNDAREKTKSEYIDVIFSNIANHTCEINYNRALYEILDIDELNKLNVMRIAFDNEKIEKEFVKHSIHKAEINELSYDLSYFCHMSGSLLIARVNHNGPWRRNLFDLICLSTYVFADDLLFSPQIFGKISGYLSMECFI